MPRTTAGPGNRSGSILQLPGPTHGTGDLRQTPGVTTEQSSLNKQYINGVDCCNVVHVHAGLLKFYLLNFIYFTLNDVSMAPRSISMPLDTRLSLRPTVFCVENLANSAGQFAELRGFPQENRQNSVAHRGLLDHT